MLAKIIDIQYNYNIATVVLNTKADIQYVYAEPRLLSVAIDEAFGNDWKKATIDADIEGKLLVNFTPIFNDTLTLGT